jgi:hypothetical protein
VRGYLLHVPVRMQRPAAARQALRRGPLSKASRADPSRVERVPLVATEARPKVLFPGRPTALRAPDARAGRAKALLLLRLRTKKRRRFGGDIRAHGPSIMDRFHRGNHRGQRLRSVAKGKPSINLVASLIAAGQPYRVSWQPLLRVGTVTVSASIFAVILRISDFTMSLWLPSPIALGPLVHLDFTL